MSLFSDKKIAGLRYMTCQSLKNPLGQVNLCFFSKLLYVTIMKPEIKLIISAVRACSHEPGTVNYPMVMIAPGQALPRVHMMICCTGASLSKSDHYEFI